MQRVLRLTSGGRVICKVEGCGRAHLARGFCSAHYDRWRNNGDPGGAAIGVYDSSRICAVPACDRQARARGWCIGHYNRWVITGDPGEAPLVPHAKPRTHTYRSAHVRVCKAKGKASAHPCAHCSGIAADWSYDHADPDELTGDGLYDGLVYSLDPDHYLALCRACHRGLDKSVRELSQVR